MPKPRLEPKESLKRRRERIWIGVLTLLFIFLTAFEFRLIRSSGSMPLVNSVFFFGILNLNLIILIALVWLVFRNVGKLVLERRGRILGSKLKSKLVVAFLSFALVPTIVLFIISSLYINSSFDKWFSVKVQNTLEGSIEITRTFYRNSEANSVHFAEHLARQAVAAKDLQTMLDTQRSLLSLNAIEFYPSLFSRRLVSQAEASASIPRFFPRLALDLLERGFAGERVTILQHLNGGDLLRVLMPIQRPGELHPMGVIVVDTFIPVSLVSKVDEISNVFDDYKELNPLQYPVKTAYFVLLIMMTLVIIFVAIWIGLYLARELTVPVERLVRGAQAVGGGNLDVKIESSGQDEISTLVDSFNHMTRDLKENRERLRKTAVDAETRKLQLEAVLANVGTGVIVVDDQKNVSTFNRAAALILNRPPESVVGKPYSESLDGALAELIGKLELAPLESSRQAETAQWNDHSSAETRSLAAIGTPLVEGKTRWGVVVVLEDMTYLIKGQREMAWREVARRIAHEIKNPLTPIKLSAQRMQRRLTSSTHAESDFVKECTDLIIQNADALKELANEFSNFARFPEANPSPNDLNEAVNEVVQLYRQAHPSIRIQYHPAPSMPIFDFDREQIKRVVINLIENAVAAVEAVSSPLITLRTELNPELKIAVLSIEDNGVGMPEEVKSRLFEPYFSTKSGGTGLGLAITKRIVSDHDGFIRVQSAPDQHTTFVIELPLEAKTIAARQSPHLG